MTKKNTLYLPPHVLAKRMLEGLYRKKLFPDSKKFWKNNYKKGKTSGMGSYGTFAIHKAKVINDFVAKHNISSVLEFGCGDGNQVSLFKIPRYVGLDISTHAIKQCQDRFKDDKTKGFYLYEPDCFVDGAGLFSAELVLSLEVLFHLIETNVFETYMHQLFGTKSRFIIILANDTDENTVRAGPNCLLRKFTSWVERNIKGWELMEVIECPASWGSDFYVYKKKVSQKH